MSIALEVSIVYAIAWIIAARFEDGAWPLIEKLI